MSCGSELGSLGVQVDFFVTQRRRAMACAVNAVGFAGHRAVLAGDTALATAALEVLLPHTLGHEEVRLRTLDEMIKV